MCPHCRVGVRLEAVTLMGNGASVGATNIRTPSGHELHISVAACPSCGRPIVAGTKLRPPVQNQYVNLNSLFYPDALPRSVPEEVKTQAAELAADFLEAVAVFPKSKKASAALSRRCLQNILVSKGGAKKANLAEQIDEVLPRLPEQLALNVDAIRQIGNFAAHPTKSTSTGAIADVEDGEAEWLLDVLDELFEHYYVAPTQAATRRDALNRKLAELGKPPLKTP